MVSPFPQVNNLPKSWSIKAELFVLTKQFSIFQNLKIHRLASFYAAENFNRWVLVLLNCEIVSRGSLSIYLFLKLIFQLGEVSSGVAGGHGHSLLPHQRPRPPHPHEAARKALSPIPTHSQSSRGRDPHVSRHILSIKGKGDICVL